MKEVLAQLVNDLENAYINLAALEQTVFKHIALAKGEYRDQREIQAVQLKNHFETIREQISAAFLKT